MIKPGDLVTIMNEYMIPARTTLHLVIYREPKTMKIATIGIFPSWLGTDTVHECTVKKVRR